MKKALVFLFAMTLLQRVSAQETDYTLAIASLQTHVFGQENLVALTVVVNGGLTLEEELQLQMANSLPTTNWITIQTLYPAYGTNIFILPATNNSAFFRLLKTSVFPTPP